MDGNFWKRIIIFAATDLNPDRSWVATTVSRHPPNSKHGCGNTHARKNNVRPFRTVKSRQVPRMISLSHLAIASEARARARGGPQPFRFGKLASLLKNQAPPVFL